MANVYWRDAISKGKEIKLVGKVGTRMYKQGRSVIFWNGQESMLAQLELERHIRFQNKPFTDEWFKANKKRRK